ncbi:MAG: 6-carboxytetrahydropterin synthase [Sedimentisphaerales bacterium]|nr:6-carboxytetrahydropterin synthase [Sedimentisphaerales bacterium]
MFTVSVETHFWASHQLTMPDGSKEPAHRHNWSVRAEVGAEKLTSSGFVIDFLSLRKMLDNIVAQFDNIPLEKIDYFQQNNPSAENVAKYIYEKLEPKLPNGLKVQSVRVTEGPNYSAKLSK